MDALLIGIMVVTFSVAPVVLVAAAIAYPEDRARSIMWALLLGWIGVVIAYSTKRARDREYGVRAS